MVATVSCTELLDQRKTHDAAADDDEDEQWRDAAADHGRTGVPLDDAGWAGIIRR
jgi:hypothetical protein